MIQIDIPNIDEIKQTMYELKLTRTIFVGTSIFETLKADVDSKIYRLSRWPNCQLPGCSGVYFIFNSAIELLYVGVTRNLFKRFHQHSSRTRWFHTEAAYVAYVLSENIKINPERAEEIYISLYSPKYNGLDNNVVGEFCLIEVHNTNIAPQIIQYECGVGTVTSSPA